MGKTNQRKTQQEPKTKDIHRVKRNQSPRSVRSGDQGDCTQNLTGILPQKFTPKTQGVRKEQLQRQSLTGRISQTMGRQRNNPPQKGKGEVSETMLNEKEASQLSDIEFKEMVIRKLNELTQNYQKQQGNYNELTAKYINMKKETETINKCQEEMKNVVSERKNTEEGIKIGLTRQRTRSANWRTR